MIGGPEQGQQNRSKPGLHSEQISKRQHCSAVPSLLHHTCGFSSQHFETPSVLLCKSSVNSCIGSIERIKSATQAEKTESRCVRRHDNL